MAENGKLYQVQQDKTTLSMRWGARITEMMVLTHTGLLIFFWMLGVHAMAAINVISILIYTLEFRVLKKSPMLYLAIFIVEVLCHMILAIVFVGWNAGFQYYTFAMIPVMFFADHTIRKEGGSSTHPMLFTALTILTFFACRFISYRFVPVYPIPIRIAFWTNTINGTMILLMLAVFSMIYVQRILEIENELVTNAEFDELTKLPNRHYLDRLLEEQKIGAAGGIAEYAVAILDIDNFKKVNDRFGHLAGDQVLKKLAGILARTASDNENIFAARWGGEEFMLLAIRENAFERLMELAEDVRRQLEDSVVYFDYWQIVVTASIGVSGTRESLNFKDLTEEADKCLYEAKGSGKNVVIGK